MKTIAVRNIAVCVLLAAALLSSCGDNPSKKASGPKPFPQVSVPAFISSQEDVYNYLAKNWWNRYLDSSLVWSQDTSLIGGITKGEFVSAYHNYVQVLLSISPKNAYGAQSALVERIQKLKMDNPSNTVFDSMVSLTEMVLYGVNSDYRNEEYYLPFAQALSTSPLIDSLSRTRYAGEAANCSLNRLGEVAADFSYTTKEGRVSTLHKIKADYTLVFFSNPGCHACKEIIDALKGSLKVSYLEEKGSLKVLNTYIDEDLTEWYKYMPVYPDEWINAYNADLSIRTYNLYDVRAIPSLYLLDKEKRVIFKDVPFQVAMNYLENI